MFAKFTGEHLYQSLFFKNLFKKKDFDTGVSLVNFAKF